jgi:YesN/AraC family two-component response regulator
METRQLENLEYSKKKELKKTLFISLCGLIVSGGLGFYFFTEKRTSKDLKNRLKLKIEREQKKQRISKEKEDEILKKLEEFEYSRKFLNKNMSLAILAGEMNTNTKYLTEIINKYKSKNFNLYINEQRINYIISLMESDLSYLNYKLSYLADIGGFSSHSAFTTVFKTVTGLSPNAYIQQLKSKSKKNEEK